MSNLPEIQQIPARHGTATFVPRGHVIKIINTYGRQVVDTWAFALPNEAPSQKEMDEEDAKNAAGEEAMKRTEEAYAGDDAKTEEKEDEEQGGGGREAKDLGQDKDEGSPKGEGAPQKMLGSETERDGDEAKESTNGQTPKTPQSRTWSSYIPSVPSIRGKDKTTNTAESAQLHSANKQPEETGEKRTWASYFPSGKGFSNYVPSKKSLNVSAFANSHYRDPTKSYAEQLYDFSKTPVGAGALSYASGSGYFGTAYAGWQAFSKQIDASRAIPPMEYLSMPHTHTATMHVCPKVNDVLVSNLRQPLLRVVEDTAACHDTIIAACDPHRYRQLGVQKWEEHGSCAENLVLALKELNENAGLKGNKAVGTDVTVNTVPPPLNLFMNVPWQDYGTLSFEGPKGKKGEYIRLQAERDVVVVMSACPMDVTPINGGKCMAAHFVVQESEAAQEQQQSGTAPARPAPKKAASSQKKEPQVAAEQSAGAKSGAKSVARNAMPTRSSNGQASTKPSEPNAAPATNGAGQKMSQPAPKPGRQKPKKLERRMPSEVSQASTAR